MALAHALVTAPDATPDRFIVFLHGILGSGANWRGFARRLVAARPRWGAVLVDLRLHGDSQEIAPPHTVLACARDVREIVHGLPGPARAVLGHSFGGKVALAFAGEHDLDRLFVIDSTPGPREDAHGSESTKHIVELLATLPKELPDRAAFDAFMLAHGISPRTVAWLAMNVRPIPSTTRYKFRVDIAGVRALLADYFAYDAWPVLEHPRGERASFVVVGGRSDVVDAKDRARAAACPRCHVEVLADAGHWVHVDAPDALLAIVTAGLDA